MGQEFRKHVLVCTKDAPNRCGQMGGMEIFRKFREEIAARGLQDILTTQLGCTGQHAVGPTVVIHPDGVWYKEVKPEDVGAIIDEHLVGGKVVERLVNSERSVKG